MIKNQTIIEKLKERTADDKIMQEFLLDIINHENENSQYTRKYKSLIEKAVGGEGK
jgi:hypothetical protein